MLIPINSELTVSKLTMFHHYCKKLDDNFGTRANKNLTFAPLLGIVNRSEGIRQCVHKNHDESNGRPTWIW